MTTTTYTDSIECFLDLILETHYTDFPAEAIAAAKVFLLDTAGVARAGQQAPLLANVIDAAKTWGADANDTAAIWNTAVRLPGPAAAMVNGYQCHALEYDCVYESGVVLPTPPIFSALVVMLERLHQRGHQPHGTDILKAFIVALEVACTLADAAKSRMFFFRPATTGIFSALAAMACLAPMPRETLRHAFGIAYSQMCGPMQAHEEGSMMLAMQMGFAARGAVCAYDLAEHGITAPAEILDGRFGYFNNFESEVDAQTALARVARPWKVTQLSHKPFPSGRVTHGAIHALRELRKEFDLTPQACLATIEGITVSMPPLGKDLVGRPMIHNPAPNYARLCVPFVMATELLYGSVDPTSFTPARLRDPDIEALARRFVTVADSTRDPNAFYPQHLTLRFRDGRVVNRPIPHAWGSPAMPLDRAAQKAKFSLCCQIGNATDTHAQFALIDWIGKLDAQEDCTTLLNFLAADSL